MHILKEFKNFEDGIKELKKNVPVLTEYLGDESSSDSEVDVINNLLNKIKEDIPTISNPKYPSTYAISVHAREVGFKAKDYVSFGWRVLIDETTNIVTYSFRVTVAKHFSKKSKIESVLTEIGWRAIPSNHTRFRKEENTEKA